MNKKEKELLDQVKTLVQLEQKTTAEILKHLCEVEKRALYVELGYNSLFKYLCKELLHSEAQAMRRINACKLLQEFPKLEEKIKEGKHNLTNLSQSAQAFKNTKLTHKEKEKVLEQIEEKSTRDAQNVLFDLTGAKTTPSEKQRRISKEQTSVTITLENELLEKIEKLKAMKNRARKLTLKELLENLVNQELDRLIASPAKTVPLKASKQRVVTGKLKKALLERANYMCEHKDCQETHFLEAHHCKPWIMNGKTCLSNLKLLCKGHHNRETVKFLS